MREVIDRFVEVMSALKPNIERRNIPCRELPYPAERNSDADGGICFLQDLTDPGRVRPVWQVHGRFDPILVTCLLDEVAGRRWVCLVRPPAAAVPGVVAGQGAVPRERQPEKAAIEYVLIGRRVA